MMIDYSLQVPAFLLRTECQNKVVGPGETPWVMPKRVGLTKLTESFKYNVAMDIYAAIKSGCETFGQIHKKLNYTKRELRAGFRFGQSNWLKIGKVVGRGRSRQLTTKQVMIVIDGKRYKIIDY